MAQKRMLDKKISVSEQVANMQMEAQLFFTWCIPHADDIGMLPHSPRTLKALVVPMIDKIGSDEITEYLGQMVTQNLIEEYTHSGEKYWRIRQFLEHQTLKRDRQPQTILKVHLDKDPKVSWKHLEDIGFQMEPCGFQMESEVKRSEEKRRESKPENSLSYLKNIPEADLEGFYSRFDCSKQKIQSKAEDLHNYCLAKGKHYKNYKAFLYNAVKKDFPLRPPPPEVLADKTKEIRTDEDRKKISEQFRGGREILGRPIPS